MAPVDRVDHGDLEQQLKDIIQDMYQIMVQVSTYDAMGRPSKDVLSNEVKTLSHSLQTLHTTASATRPDGTGGRTSALPSVPPELLEYVENGRNPDIYTREFVELVRRGNQLMRGKTRAFGTFRDVLAEQMATAMPELREDVERVVEATGGERRVGRGSVGAGATGNANAGGGDGASGAGEMRNGEQSGSSAAGTGEASSANPSGA